MKKIISKQFELKTFDDVNGLLFDLAALQLSAEKLENKMNKKMLEAKKEFEPGIINLKTKIKEYENLLEDFCKRNKKEFSSPRSRELTYGRIGYRTGQNQLRILNKKFTWESVKEKFFDVFGSKYVQVKTTLGKKEILLAADKGDLNDEQLASCGVKVIKEDSSFYEIFFDKITLDE